VHDKQAAQAGEAALQQQKKAKAEEDALRKQRYERYCSIALLLRQYYTVSYYHYQTTSFVFALLSSC
jgi:hypothetical protein